MGIHLMERAAVVSEVVPPLIRVSLLPPGPHSFKTVVFLALDSSQAASAA